MGTTFLCEDGIDDIINDLDAKLESYACNIDDLVALYNEIESSPEWRDENIKVAFLNTYKGYISGYVSFYKALKGYENCLNTKVKNVRDNEDLFVG